METTKQTKECLVIDERWTSTTDQYPRIGERVLVRYLCDDGEIRYVKDEALKSLVTREAFFAGEFIIGRPTHWRYLETNEEGGDE